MKNVTKKELIAEFKKLGSVGKSYITRAGAINSCTFCPNNPYQSAFNEGRRSLALQLLALIDETEVELESQTSFDLDFDY